MKFLSDKLRADIINKRVIDLDISMDEAAIQIGISKHTLSRLENRKLPDIETFGKVCQWLDISPREYFNFLKKEGKD